MSSYDTTSSGDYRVTDLRKDTRLLFSTNLIDDNIVLFKDRPSTGTNKFNQNIEFGLDVDISGTLTLSSGVDYTVTPDSNTVSISSSTGEHLKLLQESSTSKVRVPYLETTTLKVLTGGEYRDVVTAGPASTLPRNLRIYDIYPTEDPNEKKGYVEIR